METQQSHVLCPHLHLHKGVRGYSQVDIWKGGENAKSRPSSFAGGHVMGRRLYSLLNLCHSFC